MEKRKEKSDQAGEPRCRFESCASTTSSTWPFRPAACAAPLPRRLPFAPLPPAVCWRQLYIFQVSSRTASFSCTKHDNTANLRSWLGGDASTGTVPVLSIASSSCSCCSWSSSSSRSCSSTALVRLDDVSALTISSLSSFCSRILSLRPHISKKLLSRNGRLPSPMRLGCCFS